MKTKCIIFGNKPVNLSRNLTISNTEIEIVSENKFLGVIGDDKLSWKSHINHVKSKMAKSIAILYKAKDVLSQNALITLYYSLIAPYMTYCIEVWGNTYKTNTNPIFLLQKKAIRIISKKPFREPTNPLFICLKILKFKDLVDYITIQTMYKAKNKLLPPHVQNLFKMRDARYNLKGTLLFEKPKTRTNAKNHCVSVKGVNIWNNCPENIKLCCTLVSLKRLY